MLRRRPLLSCSSLVYPACPDPVGERLSRRANHLPAVAATSRSPAFATCAPRFHLSPFLSSSCALFCAMGAPQLLSIQALPHSFHRNGGVGGRIGLSNQEVLPEFAGCRNSFRMRSYGTFACNPFRIKLLRIPGGRGWGLCQGSPRPHITKRNFRGYRGMRFSRHRIIEPCATFQARFYDIRLPAVVGHCPLQTSLTLCLPRLMKEPQHSRV